MLQSFIVILTLTFSSGDVLTVVGDTYSTYNMCMANGTNVANAIFELDDENTEEGEVPVVEEISVWCEPLDDAQEVPYCELY